MSRSASWRVAQICSAGGKILSAYQTSEVLKTSEVSDAGGFDVVIGNPPYIPIETMAFSEKEYYLRRKNEIESKLD